jgi:hypothetical protein
MQSGNKRNTCWDDEQPHQVIDMCQIVRRVIGEKVKLESGIQNESILDTIEEEDMVMVVTPAPAPAPAPKASKQTPEQKAKRARVSAVEPSHMDDTETALRRIQKRALRESRENRRAVEFMKSTDEQDDAVLAAKEMAKACKEHDAEKQSDATAPADEPAPAVDPAPEDPAPKESAPEDPVPEDTAPKDSASEDPVPEDTAPKDSASEDPVPEDTAPKDSASEDPVPKDTTPEDPVPKDTTPDDPAPGDLAREPTGEAPVVPTASDKDAAAAMLAMSYQPGAPGFIPPMFDALSCAFSQMEEERSNEAPASPLLLAAPAPEPPPVEEPLFDRRESLRVRKPVSFKIDPKPGRGAPGSRRGRK